MFKYLNMLKLEFLKNFWTMKRYYFNTIVSLIILYIVFLGMFYGFKTFGGKGVTQGNLDSMIIGYSLWMFALFAFSDISSTVLSESQAGTLEQLHLSPLGTPAIFICKTISNIIISFIMIVAILYIMMLSTGKILDINFIHFIGITFISVLSLLGFGFVMGGLALIHKKVNAISEIINFALAGILFLDVYLLNIFSFLPFAAGAYTVRASIVEKQEFSLNWYLFITANSLFYLFAGIFIFNLLSKKAKRLNKLGQY